LKAIEWQKEECVFEWQTSRLGHPISYPLLASTRHPASHHDLLDVVNGGLVEPHKYFASHIFVSDALQSSEQNAIGHSLTWMRRRIKQHVRVRLNVAMPNYL
jgi:hypothetical protein